MSEKLTGNILVGTWKLNETSQNAPKEEMLLSTAGEATFADDKRKVVSSTDFKKGGKYRSIVKLQIRFENQTSEDKRWAMGTGWLVKSDLLVTAGHCVYDWSSGLGRASAIKAYIGYDGKASITDANSDLQFRQGSRIATTSGWLSCSTNRVNDVAFVQLEDPFKDITPINYSITPMKNKEKLGVVGYPADKIKDSEHGAQMYEEFGDVDYDLSTAFKNMLEYRISTYAGQSGSPVLRSGKNESIGAHAYGGLSKNSASPIAGDYGNLYGAYIQAFDKTKAFVEVKTANNIKYISVPCEQMEELDFGSAFLSAFKVGAKVTSGILTTGSPFLGPVGGAVAALAGTALGFAGSLCESNMGAEAAISKPSSAGHAQRALMAEAAYQSLHLIDLETYETEVRPNIKSAYNKIETGIYKLEPKLFPILMQPALRMALNAYRKEELRIEKLKAGIQESTTDRQRVEFNHASPEAGNLDSKSKDFLDQLLKPTLKTEGEESFFDDLADCCESAIRITKPVGTTAPTGLSFLSSILAGSDLSDVPTATDKSLTQVCHRAVIGEATLQTLINIDHSLLPEGFFDALKDVAQDLGRVVVDSAPWVIEQVTPILVDILKGTKSKKGTAKKINEKKVEKKTQYPKPSGRSDLIFEGQYVAAQAVKGKRTLFDHMIEQIDKEQNLDGLAFQGV